MLGLGGVLWGGVGGGGLAWVRHRRREFRLDAKVVVITGAAHGLGRRLAWKIVTDAANVTLVLLDTDRKALETFQTRVEQQARPEGDKTVVLIYECDVANYGAVRACMARVVARIAPKHIEVLVNNAGVVMGRPLTVLTPTDIERTFAVNTLAHFWTLKTALSSMKKAPEALLVTVSSVMGLMSSAGLTDYCASKAAVNALHEAGAWVVPFLGQGTIDTRVLMSNVLSVVRLELWHDNVQSIRTLLICPAAVDTGMFAGALAANDWAAKISRFFLPMLSESEVVDTMYRAMRNGDKELVVSCFSGWRRLPMSWAPAIARLLPVPWYDMVIRVAGGLHGMDTFIGKQSTYAKKKAQ